MGNFQTCCYSGGSKMTPEDQQQVRKIVNSVEYQTVVIELIQGDPLTETADAIINACMNPYSVTESYLLKKAGNKLQSQLMAKSIPETCQASISDPGNLHAKKIIHLTLPYFSGKDGALDDLGLLVGAYNNALRLAQDQGIQTLIFCDDQMNSDQSVPKNFQAMAISIALTSYIEECLTANPEPGSLNLKNVKIMSTNLVVIRNFDYEFRKRIDISGNNELKEKWKIKESQYMNSISEKVSMNKNLQNSMKNQKRTKESQVSYRDDFSQLSGDEGILQQQPQTEQQAIVVSEK